MRGTGLARAQRGAALLLALLIAITLGLAFLFQPLDTTRSDFAREPATEDAFAQAKAALIGYAATYRDTHPNESPGYLPCPDTNNDGEAEGNCGNAGESMIGRLPYKTLGLPDLRAADGECLWYIVSGSHKNNPKSAPLNWDTRAQIRIQDSTGAALTDPGDSQGGAVAVLIAPGAPLAGQTRPSGNLRCSGDASNSLTGYLDGNYAAATAGTLTVTAGQPRSTVNNDRLAWIGARELFAPIARRNDLPGTLLTQLTACLNFTTTAHIPATHKLAAGSKWVADSAGLDEVRAALGCPLDAPGMAAWTNWKDHFRYVICGTPSAACLQVNGSPCSGALLFGGRLTSGNPRSAAEKLVVSNYFDAGNTAALTTATTALTGAQAYSGSAPEADLALCLQPDPPPPALNFQDNMTDLAPVAVNYGGKTLASVDVGQKTLTLGDTALSGGAVGVDPAQLFGCAWFNTTLPFRGGLRAYFRYRILNKGNGFVLALADATANPDTARCGRGEASLGYSGLPNNGIALPGLTVHPIRPPKIGLEIDTRTDLSRGESNGNHMAIVYWGDPTVDDDDNLHGSPAVAIAGSPKNPSPVTHTQIDDLNTFLHVRLEIVRTPVAGGHSHALKAWALDYLPPDFDLLTNAFDEDIVVPKISTTATIPDLADGSESLRNLRIGFTNAASAAATSDQRIEISNFSVRITP